MFIKVLQGEYLYNGMKSNHQSYFLAFNLLYIYLTLECSFPTYLKLIQQNNKNNEIGIFWFTYLHVFQK